VILVDTPVWIDHFHAPIADFQGLLVGNVVLTHPWVIGEIALGSIKHRQEVLEAMNELPVVTVAKTDELHALLNAHQLWSRGIGWVDLGLLASARLSHAALWTRDKGMAACAGEIGIDIHPY
jgi:predicted nucleic acid-binding protein